ncbi:MAG: hypothetical protein RIT22_1178 [Bacteroidota bacterium]|jgi:hypothetical protein
MKFKLKHDNHLKLIISFTKNSTQNPFLILPFDFYNLTNACSLAQSILN